jgi:hypothetical protein
MKSISVLALILTIFLISPVTGFSQDLSSNIMRRVDAANLELDTAEAQIQTGKAEFAPSKIKSAQAEYENIFNYYGGSFDPNHPTLVTLENRIKTLTRQAEEAADKAAQAQTTMQETEKEPTVSKPAQKNTPENLEGKSSELSANIRRRIDQADRLLAEVRKRSETKGDRSIDTLNQAKREYQNIFEYYQGSFDPNHPDIIALQKRIAETEEIMNAGFAAKNATAPLENNSEAVEDLPADMGNDLVDIARSLYTLEDRLDTASNSGSTGSYVAGVTDDLAIAEGQFSRFNAKYGSRIDPGHVAYAQVESRLRNDRQAVNDLKQKAGAAVQAARETENAAYKADEQRIMSKYSDIPPTSDLHRNNQGKIVWSKKPINFSEQDQVTPEQKFRLSEPIFGRLYLHHSLGNTPVYGSSGGPDENRGFGYEFKLFIDGQEKTANSNVFTSGNLSGQAGETWTTWQFAPNPVPFDDSFKNEADAWRRTTAGLSPGTHAVRIELWGVQGQFRTREPVSIGEFSLIVENGDRIAAGTKFPQQTYSGKNAAQLGEQLKRALAQENISYDEIAKLAITGDWAESRYTDSKNEYRKISAAVLFKDKENDGVCRFVTYNFISDKNGSEWAEPRFHSFCNGCPEGDAECPQ